MTEYEKRLEKAIEKMLETIAPEDPDMDLTEWLIDVFGSDFGFEIYEILLGKYREK